MRMIGDKRSARRAGSIHLKLTRLVGDGITFYPNVRRDICRQTFSDQRHRFERDNFFEPGGEVASKDANAGADIQRPPPIPYIFVGGFPICLLLIYDIISILKEVMFGIRKE